MSETILDTLSLTIVYSSQEHKPCLMHKSLKIIMIKLNKLKTNKTNLPVNTHQPIINCSAPRVIFNLDMANFNLTLRKK